MDKMEAGLAAQQIEINQERAQIEQAAQQLQTATTQLNATNLLLQKRQAEWLAALKRIGASVGDSSVAALPGESLSPSSTGTVPASDPSTSGLLDVNTATAEQLDALPGIGPTYAQRIIEYRQQKGAFTKIDDLLNVSGIGPSTFAKFKDKIRV
jgi:comEA protein